MHIIFTTYNGKNSTLASTPLTNIFFFCCHSEFLRDKRERMWEEVGMDVVKRERKRKRKRRRKREIENEKEIVEKRKTGEERAKAHAPKKKVSTLQETNFQINLNERNISWDLMMILFKQFFLGVSFAVKISNVKLIALEITTEMSSQSNCVWYLWAENVWWGKNKRNLVSMLLNERFYST